VPNDRIPLMLDVDTGIDDALALAVACLSPRAELVAVSTVAGNTTIDLATTNTLNVLDMLGASHVPVYQGATRPLARPLQTADHVHGDNGIGGAELPASSRSVGDLKGPAAQIRLAQERPGDLTLVCVGPLTNLAIALNVEPGLPRLLRSVVIMGGAFAVPGNITKAAEFNFYVDPEAAGQVFDAPFASLTTIGLDVTHQAPLPRAWWETAIQRATPPQELLRLAFAESFAAPDAKPVYMHDALAVAAALDPSLVVTERHAVMVHSGFDERGASRLRAPATSEVAVEVDVARFLGLMQDIFSV
jgi:inosine-uridine nucleoside N-ribohydrolase